MAGKTGIAVQAMLRLVLAFSLLVASTTSAAASLCLEMENHGGITTGDDAVAVATKPSGPDPGAESSTMSAEPQGSPSDHACCHQKAGTPDATVPLQRAVPTEPGNVLSAAVVQSSADNGHPPGLFDPALEKRHHLTPSLTTLSISRT